MEENEQHEKFATTGQAFEIEAAIDERGPRTFKIVPSFGQYLVYSDEEMCSCIQLNDENEWEQIEGSYTDGVVSIIGREILRVRNLI